MKLERLIIGVLILACVWLAFHKVPKNGVDVKYITKYEQRIDTLIKDTIVYKTKIRRFKDTIIVFRDSVREAKENNDTGRMESETIYTVECGLDTSLVTVDSDDVYKNYFVNIFDERFNYGSKIVEFSNKLEAKKYAFSIYKKMVSNYQKRANMLNSEWAKQGII